MTQTWPEKPAKHDPVGLPQQTYYVFSSAPALGEPTFVIVDTRGISLSFIHIEEKLRTPTFDWPRILFLISTHKPFETFFVVGIGPRFL